MSNFEFTASTNKTIYIGNVDTTTRNAAVSGHLACLNGRIRSTVNTPADGQNATGLHIYSVSSTTDPTSVLKDVSIRAGVPNDISGGYSGLKVGEVYVCGVEYSNDICHMGNSQVRLHGSLTSSGNSQTIGTATTPFTAVYGNTLYGGKAGTTQGEVRLYNSTNNYYISLRNSTDSTQTANRNINFKPTTGGININGTGTLTVSGSDRRLKKNIELTAENGLEKINRIELKQFDWKHNDKHQKIGFVTQELQEIDEELIFEAEGNYETDEWTPQSVNTFYLQGLEIKAIQELSKKIEELEAKIKELENK